MPWEVELTVESPTVRVVAGILHDPHGNILIADRARAESMRQYWEFPGGKIENGEIAEDALCRELQEEIGIEVKSLRHFHALNHQYPDKLVSIDFYLVNAWHGTPVCREQQRIRWVDPLSLDDDELLPADTPVLEALRQISKR